MYVLKLANSGFVLDFWHQGVGIPSSSFIDFTTFALHFRLFTPPCLCMFLVIS